LIIQIPPFSRKWPNTIDGNIFNKHNDQEKKEISKKDLFYLHGIYSIQTSLF
jgi:hypothetical protein